MRATTLPACGAAALTLISLPVHALGQAAPAIPPADAARVFGEARTICDRDHGQLWGHSLCGPIMLVEPASRAIAANQADLNGALTPAAPIFTGVLPKSENIANTPVQWSGVRWTQMLWPLYRDEAGRHVLIAHELFHRIQPELDMLRKDGSNAHLDTLEGRYLLQLEWRALARALQADQPAARRRAVKDALAFRAGRYGLFPAAADNERALELNEGLAEYTGVRLGLADPKAETAYAVKDLTGHVSDPTFVRSFAYATGPAYGQLLDRYAPGWRGRLKSAPGLDTLLQAALPATVAPSPSLAARAAAYDGPALHAAEVERDQKRQVLLATLHTRFVDGPVLHIPTQNLNYEFNPTTLQPLGDLGTVFPHIRATGAFGVLEADNGALLDKDFSAATVSAAGADLKALKGDGWTLTLKPGWTVRPGVRNGDWEAVPPPT